MKPKAAKVDGHYELPLPLKNEDIQLTNNRAAAMKVLEEVYANTRSLWKN